MSTTLTLTYDPTNIIAKKAVELLMSLEVFKIEEETLSPEEKLTLKAIDDVRNGRDITHCTTFEDYLAAVK